MNEPFSLALGLGFLLGLKHATEADHIVAVTTIVSEQQSLWRSALIGTFWGIGHTVALFFAGVVVILLRVRIPESIANILEFFVALMIIFLGMRILYKLSFNKETFMYKYHYNTILHSHMSYEIETQSHNLLVNSIKNEMQHSSNKLSSVGWRPLFIGIVHGLAGSAALTLLILTEITKGRGQLLGIVYLLIFGVGSIGGMILMSTIISLPFIFTSAKFETVNRPIKLIASIGSIIFGFYYAWEIFI